MYDHDYLSQDDLVGTFKMAFKSIDNVARWVNLYGGSINPNNEKQADLMNAYPEKGS